MRDIYKSRGAYCAGVYIVFLFLRGIPVLFVNIDCRPETYINPVTGLSQSCNALCVDPAQASDCDTLCAGYRRCMEDESSSKEDGDMAPKYVLGMTKRTTIGVAVTVVLIGSVTVVVASIIICPCCNSLHRDLRLRVCPNVCFLFKRNIQGDRTRETRPINAPICNDDLGEVSLDIQNITKGCQDRDPERSNCASDTNPEVRVVSGGPHIPIECSESYAQKSILLTTKQGIFDMDQISSGLREHSQLHVERIERLKRLSMSSTPFGISITKSSSDEFADSLTTQNRTHGSECREELSLTSCQCTTHNTDSIDETISFPSLTVSGMDINFDNDISPKEPDNFPRASNETLGYQMPNLLNERGPRGTGLEIAEPHNFTLSTAAEIDNSSAFMHNHTGKTGTLINPEGCSTRGLMRVPPTQTENDKLMTMQGNSVDSLPSIVDVQSVDFDDMSVDYQVMSDVSHIPSEARGHHSVTSYTDTHLVHEAANDDESEVFLLTDKILGNDDNKRFLTILRRLGDDIGIFNPCITPENKIRVFTEGSVDVDKIRNTIIRLLGVPNSHLEILQLAGPPVFRETAKH